MFHLALATAATAVNRNVAGHVIQSFYNTNVFFDAQKHDSRTSRELLFGSDGDVTLFMGGKWNGYFQKGQQFSGNLLEAYIEMLSS